MVAKKKGVSKKAPVKKIVKPKATKPIIKTEAEPHPIDKALSTYLSALDDYIFAIVEYLPVAAKQYINSVEETRKKLERFDRRHLEEGMVEYRVKGIHPVSNLTKLLREADRLNKSQVVVVMVRSFFIGIFSEYDSFIGNLLKAIYSCKPELYRNISREISLSDLLAFGDIDAIKQDMLEKEIDSFRRDSYSEQFQQLEKRFGIATLRNFKEWPFFVEAGERRNVMAHNGGLVSEQYLLVCDREKYIFEKRPEVGAELLLPAEYLFRTIRTVGKVGFMLAHTLWRKVLPSELKIADDRMNAVIYDLMLSKRWRSASEFSEFALSEPMFRNTEDMLRRIRTVNSAIALKRVGKGKEALALLDQEDWSASIREFKLAVAVLKDDLKGACRMMREIGRSGELLDQRAYHDWPLFEDFRNEEEFQEVYKEIYKTPFLEKASREAYAKEKDLKKEIKANTEVQSYLKTDASKPKPKTKMKLKSAVSRPH